ncbi:MAG: hypothetical protein NC548_06035 [Lachnospiraceae bacterium]|nr:hypothetical protein [Lachnospiraceae bacterium]
MSIDTNYQQWLMTHDPEDKMLWKKSFWNHNVFIRDILGDLFCPYKSKYHNIDKDHDYNVRKYNDTISVIGTHWSKSIENPVIMIKYRGETIVFRYNFYDWEIAVIGNIPIILPERLIPETRFFYQGFPEKYVIKERYTHGATTFICGCQSMYQMYTLMFLLRECIDTYLDSTK